MLESGGRHNVRNLATAPDAGPSPLRNFGSPVPPADPAAVMRLRRHPRFAAAMLESARNAVELYQGSRLTNLITNDRGRFLLAIAPLYLHQCARTDGPACGFTATRLKQFALEQEICSAGRAAAMLALMRWAGMVAAAPAAADRRLRLLQPTAKLIEMHRLRWRRQLQAASPLMPELEEAAALCERDDFVAAFAVAQTRQFMAGFRFIKAVPELALFLERSAGLLVMSNLLLAEAPAASVSDERLRAVSPAAMAKRFHVSRTHVVTLLRDAVEAGLLERAEPGGTRTLPLLRDAGGRFFAAAFLFNRMAAMRAMAEIGSIPHLAAPAGRHG
ncbi:MAG: hypothetical protein AB7K35_07665 [Pseudorhodoplanes sp.]